MRVALSISSWFLCLSLVGLACGSDTEDSGRSCGDFDACGGDVKGSWKLEDACFQILEQPESDCGATSDLRSTSSSGSITFNDDTYVRHMEIETEIVVHFPEACLEGGGEQRNCSDYNSTLMTGASLVCDEAEDGGCDCSATVTSTFNDDSVYSVRGTRLDLRAESVDYCVKDERLTLRPVVSINMAGTQVTSKLVTTFSKN